MATPHLTYRAKDTETANPLLRTVDDADDGQGGSGHLLILRRGSAWSNKTLVVPPDKEYYSCAVAYAQTSDYIGATPNPTSLTSIATDCAGAWAALDETAWHEGHKPAFQYTSRGCSPWRMRIAPSNTDILTERQYVECGGTRELLHFNCRAIPSQIGTATGQSLSAYLRFWNPSYIYAQVDRDQWLDYEDAAYNYATRNSKPICKGEAFAQGPHNCDRCWFAFFEDNAELTPSAILDTNAAYRDFVGFANQGKGNNNTYGEQVSVLRYDPWNAHHYSAAPSNVLMTQRTGIYAQGTSSANFTTAAYSADHQITGTQLTNLLKSIRKTGGAWMAIGFRPASHSDNNLYFVNGTTMTVYFSRVELVIKATGAKANT